MLVDTHCHLFFKDYADDAEAVIQRARAAGVTIMINVGIDEETSRQAIVLADEYQGIYATVGIHPHSSHLIDENVFERLRQLIQPGSQVVAIGEVGLDYYKSEADLQTQQRCFKQAVDLAFQMQLPLVVHSRNAFEDTIAILAEGKRQDPDLKAVFHCFSYGLKEMEKIVDLGFMISFSGIVTFKNAKDVQAVAKAVPMNQFLVETDSPYLTPHPHRGKRNEPSYTANIASHIAELKGLPVDAIHEATTQNAMKFFNIP